MTTDETETSQNNEIKVVPAEEASERLRPMVLFVGFLVVVLVVFVVVLQIQLTRRNKAIDTLNGNVSELTELNQRMGRQVSELTKFTEELQNTTPEEQARNRAVTEAVQLVPEIKGILCEQFPAASGCQSP